MRKVNDRYSFYTGRITSPLVQSVKCIKCGKEVHKFMKSVDVSGWLLDKDLKQVYCPECAKKMVFKEGDPKELYKRFYNKSRDTYGDVFITVINRAFDNATKLKLHPDDLLYLGILIGVTSALEVKHDIQKV